MDLASTTLASTTAIFAHAPIDWVIIIAFLIILVIDSLRSDTARAATLAVTLPLTVFSAGLLAHASFLGPLLDKITSPYVQSAVFALLFGVLFVLVYRIMYALGGSGSTPTVSIVAGLSATIITLVMWIQVPALQSVWHFGPVIETVFGAAYAFWWLIAGYLLMAFVRS
ncbi:hypothetical protein HZC00_04160 [Candidatus Kaiserbacteria bacterium]|nr:hypothetical protein [Candidatus Kaiserbacteria bacterium]